MSEHTPPSVAEEADEKISEIRHDFLKQTNLNAAKLKAEFAAVGWTGLIPFRNWFTDRPWTLLWVQFITFAFGFPFLLMQYFRSNEVSLAEAAWAFGLYFSVIWAVFLHRCLRPEHLDVGLVLGTWFFTSVLGVFAVLIISFIGNFLPFVREVFVAAKSENIIGKLIGQVLTVGILEETAKIIPIVWLSYKMCPVPRPTTVAYLGVISGLAFGATEAVIYSVLYAVGHATHQISYGDYLIVQILRLVSLPFLHAIWTGISAYFVGLSLYTSVARRAVIIVGVVGVSLLHGHYNTFADGWIGFLIAMLSLGIFIGYVRAESESVNAVIPDNNT